jgi:hypothetical protein
MSRTDALPPMPTARSRRAVPRSLSLLIEVPMAKTGPIRHPRGTISKHRGRSSPRLRPQKRRLRREVRVAVCALLALAPLCWACSLEWSSRLNRALDCAAAASPPRAGGLDRHAFPGRQRRPFGDGPASPIGPPRVVLLRIEPAVVAPGFDTEVPVVVPGYVLPEDSAQESAHEGS